MKEILLSSAVAALIALGVSMLYDVFVRRIEFKRAYFLEIIRQKNRVYESIVQELLAVQDLLSWSQYPHGAKKLLESRTRWIDLFDIVIPKANLYIESDIKNRLEEIRSEMEVEKWELMKPACAKALYDKLKDINNRFIEEMNERLNDIGKATVHRRFKKGYACRANGLSGLRASQAKSQTKKGGK